MFSLIAIIYLCITTNIILYKIYNKNNTYNRVQIFAPFFFVVCFLVIEK